MTERDYAMDVVIRLQRAGFQALWAGGCVRDELLGLTPADYDIATSARPDEVTALFKRSHGVGVSFGVVDVLGPRDANGDWITVQVATFRNDGSYSDGRRPDTVAFSSAQEDAQRRDFTINGLFYDPISKQVIDYVNGQADLHARILRAIGTASARFTEDKLRILRAVRMAARFQLTIDPATREAARTMAGDIRVVSAERIAEELRKILSHPNRAEGMRIFQDMGLVPVILPELAGDDLIWNRAAEPLTRLDASASFPLAFATLLCSLPPPTVRKLTHRFKLSNAEVEAIVRLVTHHRDLNEALTMPRSRLQSLLIHPDIGNLLKLHRALAQSKGESEEALNFCEEILRATPPEELNPPPLLTGNDLRAMGLQPGPNFKQILDAIRAAQLDGAMRTREEAVQFVREKTAS